MASVSRPPSERARVRRRAQRGAYDFETIAAILDEALVAHVGYCAEDGSPVVIPTAYGRAGETLYLHGAVAGAWHRAFASGVPVCVTVTLLDGLVLARSTFHHSMNYRSVVIFGRAEPVEEPHEKTEALERIVEHIVPGRSQHARGPTKEELDATLVLRLSLAEASAKIRTGPPIDDEADLALPIWGGVVPVTEEFGEPETDPLVPPGVAIPEHVRNYGR